MNGKRMITVLSLLVCLMLTATSLAAPASQFGFSGWPYHQNAPYGAPTQMPSSKPTATAPTALPTAAATPMAFPTAAPVPSPAPRPSTAPAATARPTEKPAQTPVSPSTVDDYTTGSITTQEENGFLLLNQDRAANGRAALTLDPELCRLARLKSRDMFLNHYFAHTSPTYGTASQMLARFGYAFTSVGENIAHYATVEKAQAAFMSSANHRKIALGSQWKKVGIGVWNDAQGFVYVTQLFVR